MLVSVKNMMLAYIFFVASACGQAPLYRVDPALDPLVKEFVKESNGKVEPIDDLVAEFGVTRTDEDKDVIGYCDYQDNRPHIVIDKEWYDKQDALGKKGLMYHELGHCILDQDHRNAKMANGCKNSIMNEYVLDSTCFKAHYAHYITELFSEGTQNAKSAIKSGETFRRNHPKDTQ